MNRVREAVIAVGLAGGLMAAGCSEPTIEQEARIVGFGQGVDVTVWQPEWQGYEEQYEIPQGATVRNVQPYDMYVGCREMEDEFFGWNEDDWACQTDIWSTCESSDTTHCEAIYERRYNYQVLEDRVVRDCMANIVKGEYKSRYPVENTSCEQSLTPDQRVEKQSRYLLWLTTENPDEEGPETITQAVEVTGDEWQRSDSSVSVTAVIQGDRIIDVKL